MNGKTMQALGIQYKNEWRSKKGFLKRDVPRPEIREGTDAADAEMVILKPHFTGVCGTDRGIWFRTVFGHEIRHSLENEDSETRIVGHEMFGEVVEAGSSARAQGWAPGALASLESHLTCGTCYQCRAKEYHVCTQEKILGISLDGCFAEYVKVPVKILWKTNIERIRPEIACMQEPFGNAVHAATRLSVKGKTIAIFGSGPIGLFTILIARELGAKKIFAIDPEERQRDLAHKFDADNVFTTSTTEKGFDTEVVRQLHEQTNGVGVDIAFEMSGHPSSVNTAIQSVRRGGDVILFGLKAGDVTLKDFDRIILRGITLHSIIGRQLFATWETTQRLLEDPRNRIQERIWEHMLQRGNGTILPFSEYTPESFERAMMRYPKIILQY